MSCPPLRRVTLVLLLAAILSASGASAARPKAQGALKAPAPLQLLSRAWSLLASLWAEEGCNIDPDGRCATGPKVSLDTGCNIDPDGHCATGPKVSLDSGCNLDPNGRCATGPKVSLDEGCNIDPNGRCVH